MITIPLYWWYLPLGLAVAGVVCIWVGSRQHGMFGGMGEGLLGLALLIAAAASAMTGWWAS